jgi:DNA-binding CsgD family transcriptional regulator
MLDALVSGPAGLALEGAPGIGKTTVWRDAVRSASDRGYGVLATAPAERDTDLAFTGLGDLFDRLPTHVVATLPAPQRRALDVALFVEDAIAAPDDPQALPRATLRILRALSADRPLLVAIDDEQWLDRPTARVLAFALARLRDEPVGVLIARRPQSAGVLWHELARGFGEDGLPSVTLGPLELAELGQLLGRELGKAPSRPRLRRIHEISAGNPLYAVAIARELDPTGHRDVGDSDVLRLTPTLSTAIAQRISRLDTRERDALLVTAALPTATPAQIQVILPGFGLGDLDAARSAAIVDLEGEHVRFTHPLLASAVYAQAEPARRRELHRLLADVVADPQARAHHLALGTEAPDRQVALTLEDAATEVARAGAPETAARLLEHACRLTPADAEHARRSRAIAAAEQHTASGDLERSRSILEELLATAPPGAQRARALLALARIRSDDFDAAAELAEEARREAAGMPRIVARAHDALVEFCANRGDPDAALAHARAGVRAAEEAGDTSLVSRLVASEALTRFFSGEGVQEELLARAIELDVGRGISSYYRAATALGLQRFWADELDSARPLLEDGLRAARERGEEQDLAGLLFHLAHLEYEAGNEALAQCHADETFDVSRSLADDQAASYSLWLQAYVAARHGVLGQARERAEEAIAVAGRIGDHFIVSFSTAIVAGCDLSAGRPELAHDTITAVREDLLGNGKGFVGSLTLNLWTTDIDALLLLDRADEAHSVLDTLLRRGDTAANPNALAVAHRSGGLVAAARGNPADAISRLEAALAEHERRPLPLEIGRTLLELGTVQRRAKRKSAAKASLEQAIVILTPLGAKVWLDRSRDELARVGLRRSSQGPGLTPAQLRVAELASQGMTNREIATTLFMSQRTVETHLTKVYSELSLKTRTQLAAALAVAQPPPANLSELRSQP